jgi:uncharacterized damage-inducible protein DinB
MNAVDVLKNAFGGAHMWYQGTVADVTEEQANAVPQGVTAPIGALMAHVLHCEDVMINQIIRGQTPIWEQDGWKDKVGGELFLDIDADAARAYKCNVPAMAEYSQAVFASTDAFLASLSEADLDRELNLVPLGFPSNMSMGAFLSQMLLGNTYAHTGEISTLKGSLGKKGYPF